MPIALLVLGGLLLTSAIKGTEHELGAAVVKDFTGSGSFLIWIAAIGIIGGIGYIPYMEKPSRYMLALILVVMCFSDQGFFSQFTAAISNPIPQAASVPYPVGSSSSGGSSGGSGGSSGGGFDVSTLEDAAMIAAVV